jgi:hypothetical protein
MTREEWLTLAVYKLNPLFKQSGIELPPVKVSCGWPSKNANGKRSRTIGQCFAKACSTDAVNEIFISPVISKSAVVLETLVHELIHASDDNKSKHGAGFSKKMKLVGLEGKPTATHAGEKLAEELRTLVMFQGLGEYPHATLDFSKGHKKQTTRLLKASCPVCAYTVRVTAKWAEMGLPICPLDGETFQIGGGE